MKVKIITAIISVLLILSIWSTPALAKEQGNIDIELGDITIRSEDNFTVGAYVTISGYIRVSVDALKGCLDTEATVAGFYKIVAYPGHVVAEDSFMQYDTNSGLNNARVKSKISIPWKVRILLTEAGKWTVYQAGFGAWESEICNLKDAQYISNSVSFEVIARR